MDKDSEKYKRKRLNWFKRYHKHRDQYNDMTLVCYYMKKHGLSREDAKSLTELNRELGRLKREGLTEGKYFENLSIKRDEIKKKFVK